MTPAPPTRRFPYVQALRAVAAASVAYVHIAHDAIVSGRDPSGLIAAVTGSMPWVAGVDVFFVISGFVIVHASARLFGQRDGPARFLVRRLIRIVPLYWVLTSLFMMTTLLRPGAVHADLGGPVYILASYLFLPWPRPDLIMEPALGLGWTLNYEMFFYLLMTPFLRVPRGPAMACLAGALCVLVTAGHLLPFPATLRFWADPIVLEFVMGMALALAVARGLTLPRWMRAILVIGAVVALHTQTDNPALGRAIGFGLPGVMLVAAAVTGRGVERTGRAVGVLVALGDASYAMYLFHPFVMRAFTLLNAHLPTRTEASGVLTVAASLIVAQACALVINRGFERRVNTWLRRALHAGAEAPVSPGGPSSEGFSY